MKQFSDETRARMSASAKARTDRDKAAGRKPWAAAIAANTGRKRSAEVREKIGAAQRGIARPSTVEFNRRPSTRASRSAIMKARIAAGTAPFLRTRRMAALLGRAGVEFEAQKQIGGKIVDFYLPGSRAVIEVDGEYWHPDPERDAVLLGEGVSFVHHVTDVQLREWSMR